jgi:hypothetical protein
MYYSGYPTVNVGQIISNASNIRTGDNPSYQVADFLLVYPQFGAESSGNKIIPETIIQLYIDLADASIKEARWHKAWKIAMGLFVAHWCTTWLRSSVDTESADKEAIVQSGQTQGIVTTESVDGVSYSMDIATVMEDLKGYGMWKTTEFGANLASLAKAYGKGMMLIW